MLPVLAGSSPCKLILTPAGTDHWQDTHVCYQMCRPAHASTWQPRCLHLVARQDPMWSLLAAHDSNCNDFILSESVLIAPEMSPQCTCCICAANRCIHKPCRASRTSSVYSCPADPTMHIPPSAFLPPPPFAFFVLFCWPGVLGRLRCAKKNSFVFKPLGLVLRVDKLCRSPLTHWEIHQTKTTKTGRRFLTISLSRSSQIVSNRQ